MKIEEAVDGMRVIYSRPGMRPATGTIVGREKRRYGRTMRTHLRIKQDDTGKIRLVLPSRVYAYDG